MKKCALFSLLYLFFVTFVYPQSDSSSPKPGVFFADIHTFLSSDINNNTSPHTGFGLSTAILGYKRSLGPKVNATILYDVTRTTQFTYPDTIGISGYFEGSKYTAYLKMAEIAWQFEPKFSLCMGMLLGDQYLTLHDKFWGHRYLATTMQEQFRFGNPADFGFRLRYQPSERMMLSVSALNGEGPFRYQDAESHVQWTARAEFHPMPSWVISVYGDIQQAPEGLSENRSAFNFMTGLKNKNWVLGAEYNHVLNNSYVSNSDLSGVSAYAIRNIQPSFSLIIRADYLNSWQGIENEMWFTTGIEYKPVKEFAIAVSMKRSTWINTMILGVNAGIRF